MSVSLKLKIGNHFENIPVMNLYWMIHFNNHQFSKSQLARIYPVFTENNTMIASFKSACVDAYDDHDWQELMNQTSLDHPIPVPLYASPTYELD